MRADILGCSKFKNASSLTNIAHLKECQVLVVRESINIPLHWSEDRLEVHTHPLRRGATDYIQCSAIKPVAMPCDGSNTGGAQSLSTAVRRLTPEMPGPCRRV